MMRTLLRTARFSTRYLRPGTGVAEEEIRLRAEGRELTATLLRPAGRRRETLPGWILLHGITRPGRSHPALVRFARALSATPAVVLIPDIEEWREMNLAPRASQSAIAAALEALAAIEGVDPERRILMGFSFGVPQALIAAADPEVAEELAAVVGFGGYAEVESVVRFQFSGVAEWEGRRQRVEPDPYGRWVMGANYLTAIPGREEAEDVARALERLAVVAGEERIPAWDARYDSLKAELRDGIAPGRRGLFDLFAPPAGCRPAAGPATELAEALAVAAREADPHLEPLPHLSRIRIPVRLAHGRGDRLIPYSETLRLRRAFPVGADVEAYLTGLFAHSGSVRSNLLATTVETGQFLGVLRRILGLA